MATMDIHVVLIKGLASRLLKEGSCGARAPSIYHDGRQWRNGRSNTYPGSLVVAWDGHPHLSGCLALGDCLPVNVAHGFEAVLCAVQEAVQENAPGRLKALVSEYFPDCEVVLIGPGVEIP